MLSQKILKSLLSYDSATGVFTRLVRTSNRIKIGDIAGSLHGNGYVRISVNKKLHLAHRLAWFYVKGYFPPNDIDHINGIRSDNRFCNLREATRTQNAHNVFKPSANNTSKFLGASYNKRGKKWYAHIQVDGIKKYLGSFNSAEEAHQAYLAAKKIYHPFAFIHTETYLPQIAS